MAPTRQAAVFVLTLACALLSSAAPTCRSKYDYIVVGAGTGGGTTASRLARNGYKVLLIDAGSDYQSNNVTIPAFHPFSTEDPEIAWDYFVKHYPASTGLRQNVLYPRSSGLGGCSIHHAMISMYPFESDFDSLAKLTGDSSWSDSRMRDYFKKIEDNQYGLIKTPFSHGDDGWLPVSQIDLRNLVDPLDAQLLAAAATVITEVKPAPFGDINGIGSMSAGGWHLQPTSIKGGKRVGVYDLIKETKRLYPNNLDILTDTLVTKVLLDSNNNAYGVQVAPGKNLYRAHKKSSKSGALPPVQEYYTNREVILSGGTYNTPQLLMLSGIGDRTKLTALNITTRVHLPGVGRNLQDRYEVSVNYRMKNNWGLTKDCTFDGTTSDPCYRKYLETPSSVYGSNGVAIAASTTSPVADAADEDPDVYMFLFPTYFGGYWPGYTNLIRGDRNRLSILALKGRTKNTKGEVNLVSTDPRDVPNINFNYFAEGGADDIKAVTSGIRRAREWANSLLLRGFVAEETQPGPSVTTDAQIEQYIRNTAWGHHACCTAKIGNNTDPNAVLDANLKVRGVGNLRVVDASAFNKIPGFFINVPIMMLAEKAADIIGQAATQAGQVCV